MSISGAPVTPRHTHMDFFFFGETSIDHLWLRIQTAKINRSLKKKKNPKRLSRQACNVQPNSHGLLIWSYRSV